MNQRKVREEGLTRAALPLRPFALLLLQAILVGGFLFDQGRLEVHNVPDTVSYRQAARALNLRMTLAHYRTVGYPLLIRAVDRVSRDLTPIPWIQLFSWIAATALFFAAVARYFGSSWLALAAASPLLYASMIQLVNHMQPDFLSAAWVIASVSMILWLAVRPTSWPLWIGLGVVVLVSYHLRPAYLFLIGLAPLLAAVARLGVCPAEWRRILRWAAALALVTMLPYLAFAGLRWARVGHFGLVSFGGTNLAGVTASFLDDSVVAALPEEHRRLGGRMLTKRRDRGWEPYRLGDEPEPWFAQYSTNIWSVALGAAGRELQLRAAADGEGAERDQRPMRIQRNEMLSEFAFSVIRVRPDLYRQWVLAAFGHGFGKLLREGWVVWPFGLLLLTFPVERVLTRGRATGRPLVDASGRRLICFASLGVVFFLSYLLLLSLVSLPYDRYYFGTVLFLPSVLCAGLFVLWRRILTAR